MHRLHHAALASAGTVLLLLLTATGPVPVDGSPEAIHVVEGGDERRNAIVRLLQATEWVGPVFTRDRHDSSGLGTVPGTVGFGAVGWAHERSADGARAERVLHDPAPGGGSRDGDAASVGGREFRELRRFASPHANQGVAVDAVHFYAITNRAIGKHDKRTGELVDEWVGGSDGPIVHLNSGIVRDGRLYAAHSNYPGVPMVSSIEVWDVETMEHVGSHSLGLFQGSATWADRRNGIWWVGFANYEGRGGQPGRGPEWTTVVRFDDDWRPMGGYVFPPEVVERFADRSNSGGAWGPDGYLYATGHDHPEMYVLQPPDAGSTLELVQTVPVAAEGQAFAWDRTEPGTLYTIVRSTSEVVVSELVRP